MEGNTVTSRLKQFIEHCGLSNSQFADKAGIPRPTLSQLIHGRNKSVNDLLLRKLYENFPDLNISWLLFGVGNMTGNSNMQFSEAQNSGNSGSITSHKSEIQEEKNFFSQIPSTPAEHSKHFFESDNTDLGVLGAFAADLSETQTEIPKLPSPPPGKKIKSIIVLYTDSSFEVFSPDKSEI